MRKVKEMPDFISDADELEFWDTHDSSKYLDWDSAEEVVFQKLKPTTKSISLRIPEYMLAELRSIANKRDIPYQSLIKIFLKERIDKEIHSAI